MPAGMWAKLTGSPIWKMKTTTHCLSRTPWHGDSSFYDFPANGFVFNLTGFVYRNIRGSGVSDAPFFTVDLRGGQLGEGPRDTRGIKTWIVNAGVVNCG